MFNVLLIIQVIVVVCLVGVILLQRSSSDGLLSSSGGMNSFLSSRASANLLTRVTAILATAFLVNSLILAYISTHSDRGRSILENVPAATEAAPATVDAPVENTTVPEDVPIAE